MNKQYTEEEILELGRQALKRLKVTVYVVHYTHKHGDDISVYGSIRSAQASARDLISNRISETWDRYDIEHLEACATFDQALSKFHEIEAGMSYGERIEILEREVGA